MADHVGIMVMNCTSSQFSAFGAIGLGKLGAMSHYDWLLNKKSSSYVRGSSWISTVLHESLCPWAAGIPC